MDIRQPVATLQGELYEKHKKYWQECCSQAKEQLGGIIEQILMPVETPTDVPILFVKREGIIKALKFFKENLGYAFLSDITATDESPEAPRFHVVYQLANIETAVRIRIKVKIGEDQDIATATEVWPGANWAEREVWDMFGIRFLGHPDLRRILMDERWVGHPLRKDYPIKGYQIFPTPQPIDPKLLD